MDISVVIPTSNRKDSLRRLLKSLNGSMLPVYEVIIVDGGSGNGQIMAADIEPYCALAIRVLKAPIPSVCIQRNIGIRAAAAPWVLLCDDDIELTKDYLMQVKTYSASSLGQKAGAITGLVLQKTKDQWQGLYPVRSVKELLLKYIFGLSIWGPIECHDRNYFIRRIKAAYKSRGNYIGASGWPVITEVSAPSFTVPMFGLGAAVIRKSWLLEAPFDERLDPHGIGDHYGVSADFAEWESVRKGGGGGGPIHVLTGAYVYHHQAPVNRLQQHLQYYRRVMALDYFRQTRPQLSNIHKSRLLWSLWGNCLIYLFSGGGTKVASGRRLMVTAAWKALWRIWVGRNPYLPHHNHNRPLEEGRPIEPSL
jgi:glycosyltransferase involved in cell wall biosynthesis